MNKSIIAIVGFFATLYAMAQSTSFNSSYGNFIENNLGTSFSFSSANTSLSDYNGLISGLINPSTFVESPTHDLEAEVSYFSMNPNGNSVLAPSIRKHFKKSYLTVNYLNTNTNQLIDTRNYFKNSGNLSNSTFGERAYISHFISTAFSQKINSFSFGFNAKFFHENFGNYFIKNGFSTDAGINYALNKTKIGLLAKNFVGLHEFWKVNLSQLQEAIGLYNQQTKGGNSIKEMGHNVYNPTLVLGINQSLFLNDKNAKVDLLFDYLTYFGQTPTALFSSKIASSNVRIGAELLSLNHLMVKLGVMGIDKNLSDTPKTTATYTGGIGYQSNQLRLEFSAIRRKWLNESYWSFGGGLSIKLKK